MRLEKLVFCNLNSLHGKWTVDFTSQDLCRNGLFLISGPTGSGKTTLLDAISVGLYGRTPRQNTVSGTLNELMSKGEGFCSAEVTFSVRSGRFRSVWEQRRAYRKPDGQLQVPTISLFAVHDDGADELLAKQKEAGKMLVELTGLTFESFSRSMILAQGAFAEFLKADDKQRSAVLQQITGQGMYEKISRRAHELCAQARRAWEAAESTMEGITVLSSEERAAVEADRARAQDERTNAVTAREAKLHALNRTKQRDALRRKSEEAGADLRAAQASDLALDGERGRLSDDERASVLDGPGASLRKAQQDALRLTQEAEGQKAEKPVREANIRQAEEVEQTACEQKEMEERRRKELERDLTKARELDSALGTAHGEANKADAEVREAANAVQENERVTKQTKAQSAKLEREQDTVRAKLAATGRDEGLKRELSAIEVKHMALAQKKQALQNAVSERTAAETAEQAADTTRQQAEETMQNACDALKQAEEEHRQRVADREELIGTLTLPALKDLVEKAGPVAQALASYGEKLNDALTACEAAAELREQCAALTEEVAALEGTVRTLAAASENAEIEHACKNQMVTDAEKLLAAATALLQGRRALRDNEPCPCCGALDHPWKEKVETIGEDLKTQLEDRQAALHKAETALSKARKAENAARDSLADKRGQLRARHKALTDAEQTAAGKRDRAIAERETTRQAASALRLAASQPHSLAAAAKDNADQFLDLAEIRTENTPDAAKTAVHKVNILADAARNNSASLNALLKRVEKSEEQCAQTAKKVEKARRDLALRKGEEDTARAAYQGKKEYLERCLAKAGEAKAAYAAERQAFSAAIAPYGVEGADAENTDVLSILRKRLEDRVALEERSADLSAQSMELASTEKAVLLRADPLAEALAKAEANAKDRHDTVRGLTTQRAALLGGRDADAVQKEADEALRKAANTWEAARLKTTQAKTDMSNLETAMVTTNAHLEEARSVVAAMQLEVNRLCAEKGFADLDEACRARLNEETRTALREKVDKAKQDLSNKQTLLDSVVGELAELEAEGTAFGSVEDLESELRKITEHITALNEYLGGLQHKLTDNEAKQALLAEKLADCEAKKALYARWKTMDDCVGSQDGSKLRNFVQGLTFGQLLEQANQELKILSDRYILAQDPANPLQVLVIDTWMGEEQRPVSNLSGGETFQVSLALALALSSFDSGREPIQNMFMDEGFGTLDAEALEKAVDTLASLRSRNALIGVISHVDALAERIRTQITLTCNSDGVSSLRGPGCQAE